MSSINLTNISANLFDSADQLNQVLASDIADLLEAAIIEHGSASLAVSGGRTPTQFFQQLSQKPIEWHLVTITLADERWVDEDDDASNAGLVKQHLLQHLAKDATFIPFKNNAPTAKEGEAELEAQLQKIGPIDVIVLGMGTDGHTASLFPCSAELTEALKADNPKSCQSITPKTAPHERMSLTFQWIQKSRNRVIHIVGKDKLDVLQHACKAIPKPPIGLVVEQSSTPVELYYAP